MYSPPKSAENDKLPRTLYIAGAKKEEILVQKLFCLCRLQISSMYFDHKRYSKSSLGSANETTTFLDVEQKLYLDVS